MAKAQRTGDLSNLEKFVLLGLDDKGWFGNCENTIKFGLSGLILFDLFNKGRIDIEGGRVKVVTEESVGDPVEDRVISVILKSKKTRTIKAWIQRLAYRKLLMRSHLLKNLQDLGVIKKEEYSLLWIFYQNKYPLINEELKTAVQEELFENILKEERIPASTLMMIAAMDACKIVKKNLKGRENSTQINKKIEELMKFSDPLTKKQKLVREITRGIHRGIVASRVSIHA